MGSRLLLCSLLLGVLVSGRAAANDEDQAPPSRAEEVRRAFLDADLDRLATLAAGDDPDPWVLADEVCRLGAPDAALAFARAGARPDTARLADYLEERGGSQVDTRVRAAVEALDGAESEAALELALALATAAQGGGDAFERVLLETARANAFSRVKRYRQAAGAFLDAGSLAVRLGWLALAARTFGAGGEAAYYAMDPVLTLTLWERRLDVEEGRARPKDVAEALMFVGLGHLLLGDGEEARRYLEESLAAHEAIHNDDGVAWVLNNLATLHHRSGEHDLEHEALDRALLLARRVGNRLREAEVLHDLGALHSVLREGERAKTYLQEAVAIYRELEDQLGTHQTLGTLAYALGLEGEWEQAIEHYSTVLAYFRGVGHPEFTCATLNGLGYALFESGDWERARELLEEAVALGERIEDPWWGAHARESLADVLITQERYTLAEQHLELSLRSAQRLQSPLLQMIAYRGFAGLYLAQGDPARAVRASQRAIAHSDRLLAGLAQNQAVRVRDSVTSVYLVATRAAVAWGKPEAVFTATESARAGALLEALENRAEIRAATIPEQLRSEERTARSRVLEALQHYQRAIAVGKQREIRETRAALDEAQAEVERVVARIQRRSKQSASVLYPQAATLAELQDELEPGTVFVSYSLLGEDAFALVVTSKAARVVPLGPSDALRSAATLRPTVADGDPATAVAMLKARLIEPLSLGVETRRVLISPDGTLGFTPFSLLLPETEVAFVPSGTTFLVLRQASQERGSGVLALGDPDYGSPLPSRTGVAMRSATELVPLPATREEATRVGDVVLLGKQATRTALLEALAKRERWAAVHLACHGLVDPTRPARTALALAFEPDGRSLLSCEEVFTLRVPADLTVLSACETGRGAVYRSEGIVGLAQAFMLAGSPRVLVSLWKVDDEATQALMIAFYESWRPKDGKPGLPAAAALQRAQERVRGDPNHPEWQHPSYWGAWVLWGLSD